MDTVENTGDEDAVVVYRLRRPRSDVPPEVELQSLIELFRQWWLEEIDNAEFFNEANHYCPTLAATMITTYNKGE